MKRKRTSTSRWWKVLLTLHLIGYEIFFIYTLDSGKFGWGYIQSYAIMLFLWLPILLLHVGATYQHIGRGDIGQLERDAYREGFADAARKLADHSYDAPQFALDDEGELVEVTEKRKREV